MTQHEPVNDEDGDEDAEPILDDLGGIGSIGLAPPDHGLEPSLDDIGGTSTIADEIHPSDGVF